LETFPNNHNQHEVNIMALQLSDESRIITNPQRFAITQNTKVVTFIQGEPPTGMRGKRANPVINAIYGQLLTNRGIWAHVNIQITNKKQLGSIISSLNYRVNKDNLYLSTRTMLNDETKTYELWVMVTA
jgi:hypothetical protein